MHRYTYDLYVYAYKVGTPIVRYLISCGLPSYIYINLSVCSRNFSGTSRDFENTVLYFSNLSKERVFSRSFTSTVLENSRINILNILYLELGGLALPD